METGTNSAISEADMISALRRNAGISIGLTTSCASFSEAEQQRDEMYRRMVAECPDVERASRLSKSLDTVTINFEGEVPPDYMVKIAANPTNKPMKEIPPEEWREARAGEIATKIVLTGPLEIRGTLHADEEGFILLIGFPAPNSHGFRFGTPASSPEFIEELRSRNNRLFQIAQERSILPAPNISDTYPVFTMQEIDAPACALAAGKSGKFYQNNAQAQTRTYQRPRTSHYMEWELTAQEIDDGEDLATLEKLTSEGDADGILTMYYALRLLTPTEPIAANVAPAVWIDLDDVIKKIGWSPRTATERQEMRGQIYNYLKIIDRGKVRGVRSGLKIDPDTRKTMDTRIDAAIWRLGATESDAQPSLLYDVPRSVELLLSREWIPFLTDPRLVQFLPMGELLGSIPANQPRGAWARVIGVEIANFWRRNPRETKDRTMFPTRRELLTRYIPKKAPLDEILKSDNPAHARDYWKEALKLLVIEGFLANEGEAKKPNATEMPRYKWADAWLDERVKLYPGAKMAPAIAERAQRLPAIKARDLTAKPRKTRSKT